MGQDKQKISSLIGCWEKISLQIKYVSINLSELVHFTFSHWCDKIEACTFKIFLTYFKDRFNIISLKWIYKWVDLEWKNLDHSVSSFVHYQIKKVPSPPLDLHFFYSVMATSNHTHKVYTLSLFLSCEYGWETHTTLKGMKNKMKLQNCNGDQYKL